MAATWKKYRYSGPLSGVTVQEVVKNGDQETVKTTDVHLVPGREVSLPPDNQYVKDLIERRYLTESKDVPAEAPAAAASGSTTAKEKK